MNYFFSTCMICCFVLAEGSLTDCGEIYINGSIPSDETVARSMLGTYAEYNSTYTFNGRPVFLHEDRTFYLFYVIGNSASWWFIGNQVGVDSGSLLVYDSALHPVNATATWKYYSNVNSGWVPEQSINVFCLEPCTYLELTGSIPNDGPVSLLGIYRYTSLVLNSRPMYVHKDELNFLFYTPGSGLTGFWAVSNNLTSADTWDLVVLENSHSPNTVTQSWSYRHNTNNNLITASDVKFSCKALTFCSHIKISGALGDAITVGGLYYDTETTLTGRPVYKHESDLVYLYFIQLNSGSTYWIVGSTIGSPSGLLTVASDEIQPQTIITGWKYYSNSTLQWIATSGAVLTECTVLHYCQKINVYGPSTIGDTNIGNYTYSGTSVFGRPIYKHDRHTSHVFWYHSVYRAWVTINLGILPQNHSLAAFDTAMELDDVKSTWLYLNNGQYTAEQSIKVACVDEADCIVGSPCYKNDDKLGNNGSEMILPNIVIYILGIFIIL